MCRHARTRTFEAGMPPSTIPSDAPLRELLEQRRLAHRDRRLERVLGLLRARADAHDAAPRSLMNAIADFSAERSALQRRMGELRGGDGH
jgi:hypothetical protein